MKRSVRLMGVHLSSLAKCDFFKLLDFWVGNSTMKHQNSNTFCRFVWFFTSACFSKFGLLNSSSLTTFRETISLSYTWAVFSIICQAEVASLWDGRWVLEGFLNSTKMVKKSILIIQGVMSGIWNLFYHFVFNYLNAKNDYRLFRFWMKLTLELPVKSDGDYRVTGLPTEENKKFWLTENHVNYVWFRVTNYYCIALSLIFSSQLFFVRWVPNGIWEIEKKS